MCQNLKFLQLFEIQKKKKNKEQKNWKINGKNT